ncbi:MAG: hypothetical protein ACI909_002434, partial [Planctomycetota bacterium]
MTTTPFPALTPDFTKMAIALITLCMSGLIYASPPLPQYHLSADQTHNKFSRNEKVQLVVKPGAVVEVFTEDAADA